MRGSLSTDIGNVNIGTDVLAKYAGLAAVECFGIVGMAARSMRDGLTRLLRRESLSKGVDVHIDNNIVNIAFHVIVAYGVSIEAVANNLITTVKYKVESYTGLKVGKINIHVEGVRVID